MKIYLNIRFHIILWLSFISLALACNEADTSLSTFIIEKLAAATLLITAFLLGRYWHRTGKLAELDDITE